MLVELKIIDLNTREAMIGKDGNTYSNLPGGDTIFSNWVIWQNGSGEHHAGSKYMGMVISDDGDYRVLVSTNNAWKDEITLVDLPAYLAQGWKYVKRKEEEAKVAYP